MELTGDEGSVVVFQVYQRKKLRENYKELYKIMEREEPCNENEYRCKSFVKPEELLLKSSKNNDC